MKKALLPAGLAVCLLIPFAASAAQKMNTLLVVPARQRMVQLAFDMQSLRQAEVVSWTPSSGEPVLHYWTHDKWEPISLDQFRSGNYLGRKPQKTIFLGLDTPAVLTEAPLPGIARFESYDIAKLINDLNDFYAFNDGEWRLLYKRYNLMLRDANAQLRDQSRLYQPPAEKAKPRQPPVIFNTPPPATVIESKPHPIKKETPAPKIKPETVKPETVAPVKVEPEAEPAAKIESAPVKVDVAPVKVEPATVKVESAPVKAEVVPPAKPEEAHPAAALDTVIESKPAAAPEAK